MSYEEQRYAAVNKQMAEIQQQAITNPNPVKSLLSSMLLAELYARNELSHMRALEMRAEFVRTLEARIEQEKVSEQTTTAVCHQGVQGGERGT